MEENLDKNNEVNLEISDNTTKSNSEEVKDLRSEKDTNMNTNIGNSQINSASELEIKNEILINFPILTSWIVHLKYLNEVFWLLFVKSKV